MEYRPYRQYHQLPLNRVSHNFELQNRNDTCYRILAPCLQDFFDMAIWNISYRLWPKSRIIWRVEDYPVSAGEVPCREFMEWDIFSKPLPVLGAGECCYSLQGYRNGSHGSRGSQGSHGILLDLTHFEWSSSVSSSKVIEEFRICVTCLTAFRVGWVRGADPSDEERQTQFSTGTNKRAHLTDLWFILPTMQSESKETPRSESSETPTLLIPPPVSMPNPGELAASELANEVRKDETIKELIKSIERMNRRLKTLEETIVTLEKVLQEKSSDALTGTI